MAVELDGTVKMRNDAGSGVAVRVVAQDRRLRIVSGNELVGEWLVSEIGIKSLHNGFTIKAEGEEFILTTSDDVALADEIGLTAASPRLARRIATRHNPDEPETVQEAPVISTKLGAIGFALAGALIVLGGFLLDNASASTAAGTSSDGQDFSLAFVVGGVLMVAVALIMSIKARLGRIAATVALVALIVVFGFAISGGDRGASELASYGLIAGGLIVGVAVLASGSLRQSD